MSNSTPKLTQLEQLRAYQELDPRRQKIARDVLIHGSSITKACRAVNLNATRERRHVGLQFCFKTFEWRQEDAADNLATIEDGNLSLYEKVRRLGAIVDGVAPHAADPDTAVWLVTEDELPELWALGVREIPANPAPLSEDQRRRYHELRATKAPTTCTCGAALIVSLAGVLTAVPDYERYLYTVCSRCLRAPSFCHCASLNLAHCHRCQTPAGKDLVVRGVEAICSDCQNRPGTPPPRPAEIKLAAGLRCRECGAFAPPRSVVCGVAGCNGALDIVQ